MHLVYDHSRFAALQDSLVDALAEAIRANLAGSGMTDPRLLSETTFNILQDISVIIDSVPTQQAFLPFLAFRDGRKGDALIHGQGSWLHESIDADAIDALCGYSPEDA